MIVEFVGESGCGKSTLAKSVFANIEDAKKKGSLSAKDNLKALFKVISKKNTRKIFNAYFSMEIAENGLARLVRNTLYVAGLISILLIEKKDEVWIIDQGLIQFFQTVYYFKAPKKNRYAAIIRMLQAETDYRVVACRCDYETLNERIKMRRNNDKAVERRIEHADRELFDLHEKNLRLILKQIPEDKKISADTAADTQTSTKEICDFIRSGR